MKRTDPRLISAAAILTLFVLGAIISRGQSHPPVHSTAGDNEWNRGREPRDWWSEIERYHGHVGPWNVLGWRIGRAAMRELGTGWGDHALEIVCHLPLETPYTCIADGLTVATGNSIGRLDVRLAEELTSSSIRVSVRRRAGGPLLEFRPSPAYLDKIDGRPEAELHALAEACVKLDEKDLFVIERR